MCVLDSQKKMFMMVSGGDEKDWHFFFKLWFLHVDNFDGTSAFSDAFGPDKGRSCAFYRQKEGDEKTLHFYVFFLLSIFVF